MPKRTNFYIPGPAIERLKKLAQKRDVSVSKLVRRAIEEYLKREEKRKK
jgi:predicted transcriptional regulator